MKLTVASLSLIALFSIAWIGTAHAKETVLAPVGPQPPAGPAPQIGNLVVYTATEARQDGEGFPTYPHTSYKISDGSGKIVRFVSNHVTDRDETPEAVELPAGTYVVHAESEHNGFVAVPVIIQTGHRTVVDLEKNQTDRVVASKG